MVAPQSDICTHCSDEISQSKYLLPVITDIYNGTYIVVTPAFVNPLATR